MNTLCIIHMAFVEYLHIQSLQSDFGILIRSRVRQSFFDCDMRDGKDLSSSEILILYIYFVLNLRILWSRQCKKNATILDTRIFGFRRKSETYISALLNT